MPKQRLPIQLLHGQKTNPNTQYLDSLPINISAIIKPVMGASGYMQQEAGLTAYGVGEGTDRGAVYNSRFNKIYRVSGESFIEVNADGITTTLGTMTYEFGGRLASLPFSFQTQAIIIDRKYFLYDALNGFRQVTDPNVGFPVDAVWVDGYYFFTDGDYLYHTNLDDESVIDPLKYAASEFSPDPVAGVSLTTDNKVIAWGRTTIEFFENTASEFFAFSRIVSRTVQYGTIGAHTKAQIGGEWFFLGGPAEGNTSIYLLQVGTAQNISCREVDMILSQYTEIELLECWLETRIVDNYPYLIVQLPTVTLQLNLRVMREVGAEQAWTILQSGNEAEGTTGPWRAVHGVFDVRSGRWVYGDMYDERLGFLDFSKATQYCELIDCAMYTPFMYLETTSIDQLMIQTIPGFVVPCPGPPPPPPCPCPEADPPISYAWAQVGEQWDLTTGIAVHDAVAHEAEIFAAIGALGSESDNRVIRFNFDDGFWSDAGIHPNGDDTYMLTLLSSSAVLYGGGVGQNPPRLCQWDGGTTWSYASSNGLSGSADMSCSIEFEGELYFSGYSGVGGTIGSLEVLQEGVLVPVTGPIPSDGISSLAIHSSTIFGAAIGFDSEDSLYRWDGASAWDIAASHFSDVVEISALKSFGGSLYGITEEHGVDADAGNLLVWNGSDAWELAAPTLASYANTRTLLEWHTNLIGINGNGLLWQFDPDTNAWLPQNNDFAVTVRSTKGFVYEDSIYMVASDNVSWVRLYKWAPLPYIAGPHGCCELGAAEILGIAIGYAIAAVVGDDFGTLTPPVLQDWVIQAIIVTPDGAQINVIVADPDESMSISSLHLITLEGLGEFDTSDTSQVSFNQTGGSSQWSITPTVPVTPWVAGGTYKINLCPYHN